MGQPGQDRFARRLDQAEGYLALNLPERALALLRTESDWQGHHFRAHLMLGQTLARLGHLSEAIPHLERAAVLRPDDARVALNLGWCYKRTHRLAQAIGALERAVRRHGSMAILHYNLACYWSLAGDLDQALQRLEIATTLDPHYFGRIDDEADFDAVRSHPEFAAFLQLSESGHACP